MMTDDLEALFGTGFMNASPSPKKNELSVVRKDVSEYTHDDIKNRVLEEIEDVLEKSKEAVVAALEQATIAPGEGESVSAIASLLNAHSKLLETMNKTYFLHEKHRQAKELLDMKLNSQSKMNTENNMTKITMTREMVMAELMKQKDSKIIDVDSV